MLTILPQDAPKVLPQLPTIEEIIAYVVYTLNPRKAMHLVNGGMESACVTPVITAIRLPDGMVVHLSRARRNKIGAGLVRVSTERQVADGWSIADQVERVIWYFIRRLVDGKPGLCFRIYSDATLSGSMPPDDPALIKKMTNKKAERYERILRRVFLSPYTTQYTDAEKAAIEKYMKRKCASIRAGALDPEQETEADLEEEAKTGAPLKKANPQKKRPEFRPGLTVLRQHLKHIETLAFTDRSRLSRSFALSSLLSEEFKEAGVRLVGIIEPVSNSDDDEQQEFVSNLLAQMAEMRLTEICIASMRGIAQMLESGLPHGKIPFWAERIRDDNGRTLRIAGIPEGVDAMKELVRLALEGDGDGEFGAIRIATRLNEGIRDGIYIGPGFDPEEGKRGEFSTDYVKKVLNNSDKSKSLSGPNHLLLGVQRIFGLERRILPEICDDYTYGRLEKRIGTRPDAAGGRPPATEEDYIASGLINCWCGERLGPKKKRKQWNCPMIYRPERKVLNDEDRVHISLNIPDVESFFRDLLTTHPIALIESVTGTDETEPLREAWAEAAKAVSALEAERERARVVAEPEIRAVLDATLGQSHPKYAVRLANLVDDTLMDIDERIAEAKQEAAARRRDYDEYEPPLRYIDYRAQLERIDQMSNAECNAIYRRLFDPFEIQGEEPNLLLIARRKSHHDDPLPPIRIQCSDAGMGKWKRRLPPAAEWYAEVKRYLRATGGWYGDIENFEYTERPPNVDTETVETEEY